MQTIQRQPFANYTGNGWAGKHYDHDMTTTQAAAEIRKIINTLFPRKEGYRISVTREYFSMGSSIDIVVKAAPFRIYTPEYSAAYAEAIATRIWDDARKVETYTPEAKKLIDSITKIGNSFRHDDSDGQIDYFNTNFYLHTGIYWEVSKDA